MRRKISSCTLVCSALFILSSCGGETTKTEETAVVKDTMVVKEQAPLPPSQPAPYTQNLVYEQLSFSVYSPQLAEKNTLLVVPKGFTASNDSMRLDVEGTVVNAEAADISADNSPELLVVTRDGTNHGHAYVFSGNNNKSVSMVNLEDAANTKGALDGYQGEDEFALVESVLARRFPVYANGAKTGKTRQIQYKLKNGEAMKQLKVDKVIEF